MTDKPKEIGRANASPTKEFFVKMLTRDIDLRDALLDLLDNCVDGILRSKLADKANPRPYAGSRAHIHMSRSSFSIEDNCGGIPFDVAKKYAFAMGRESDDARSDGAATVGMYGIGMKRAVFKIGTNAVIESWHDKPFYVEFDEEWMNKPSWDELPMLPLADGLLHEKGTKIEVLSLNEDVSAAFANEEWIEAFRKTVSRQYSLIIDKGFEVVITSSSDTDKPSIPPEPFVLLNGVPSTDGSRIEPFVYRGTLGDVEVEIYAGLYRELLDEHELAEEQGSRGSSDDAGWSIACNDRIVVWKDKTRLTGWGEAGVPNYHGQFIAVTGLVLLRSENLKALPLTTTKHGLDAGSVVYSQVREMMREITKQLTGFTNKWKNFPDKLDELYLNSNYQGLDELRRVAERVATSASRKVPGIFKNTPTYPLPVQERTSARISFVALKSDIAKLGGHYFGDENWTPADVGLEAFTDALRKLSEANA